MLGEQLREMMEDLEGYGPAMSQWMSWQPRPLRDGSEALPTRDDLHER
jgi:hypothetical protein